MKDHPCFACTLPDCDETNRRCELKNAIANRRRDGKNASPQTREKAAFAHYELYGKVRNARRLDQLDKRKLP